MVGNLRFYFSLTRGFNIGNEYSMLTPWNETMTDLPRFTFEHNICVP
jgi:hypothetical protein